MAINTTYGFSAGQVVEHVRKYIGNSAVNTEFIEYVQHVVNLAQFRFASLNDWSFLHKTGIELVTVNGTSQYTLDLATVGYNIPNTDIKSIYNPTDNLYVEKVETQELRRFDPNQDDGGSQDYITHWAPVGERGVEFYPSNFEGKTLKIDAKVEVTPVTDFNIEADVSTTPAARLTIPYRYQESYIELVLAMVLDKENDDRAQAKMQSARAMVVENIREDKARLGDSHNPRVRHWKETVDTGYDRLDPLDWYGYND